MANPKNFNSYLSNLARTMKKAIQGEKDADIVLSSLQPGNPIDAELYSRAAMQMGASKVAQMNARKQQAQLWPDEEAWHHAHDAFFRPCMQKYDDARKCQDLWDTGAFRKAVPITQEMIELNPVEYGDHPNRGVSDYARKLINGED